MVEVTVDIAELEAAIGREMPGFVARNGVDLGLGAPVAVAIASALAHDVGWHRTTASANTDRARVPTSVATVRIAFHTGDTSDGRMPTVRDAHDLTVGGIARRASRAALAPRDHRDDVGVPTTIVSTAASAPSDQLVAATEVGVVVVGERTLRTTRHDDHLGHEVAHTRPRLTIRLHHDDRVDPHDAQALLTRVGRILTTCVLPLGP